MTFSNEFWQWQNSYDVTAINCSAVRTMLKKSCLSWKIREIKFINFSRSLFNNWQKQNMKFYAQKRRFLTSRKMSDRGGQKAWKLRNFTVHRVEKWKLNSRWKISRQINYLVILSVKTLLSRNFCQKSVSVEKREILSQQKIIRQINFLVHNRFSKTVTFTKFLAKMR